MVTSMFVYIASHLAAGIFGQHFGFNGHGSQSNFSPDSGSYRRHVLYFASRPQYLAGGARVLVLIFVEHKVASSRIDSGISASIHFSKPPFSDSPCSAWRKNGSNAVLLRSWSLMSLAIPG